MIFMYFDRLVCMSQVKQREKIRIKKIEGNGQRNNPNLDCNNTQGTCDIILVLLLKRRYTKKKHTHTN